MARISAEFQGLSLSSPPSNCFSLLPDDLSCSIFEFFCFFQLKCRFSSLNRHLASLVKSPLAWKCCVYRYKPGLRIDYYELRFLRHLEFDFPLCRASERIKELFLSSSAPLLESLKLFLAYISEEAAMDPVKLQSQVRDAFYHLGSDLQHLHYLRVFELWYRLHSLYFPLHQVKSLTLEEEDHLYQAEIYPKEYLDIVFTCFPSIEKLAIRHSDAGFCDEMAQLKALESLSIEWCWCSFGAFKQLKGLKFLTVGNLFDEENATRGWEFPVLPLLEELDIPLIPGSPNLPLLEKLKKVAIAIEYAEWCDLASIEHVLIENPQLSELRLHWTDIIQDDRKLTGMPSLAVILTDAPSIKVLFIPLDNNPELAAAYNRACYKESGRFRSAQHRQEFVTELTNWNQRKSIKTTVQPGV